MWSTTVIILSAVFSLSEALGGKIPDVTTIYKIGPGKPSTDYDSRITENTTIADRTSPQQNLKKYDEVSTALITPCINGVTGRVHARTNALGMGFLNEDYKYFDSNMSELPNITYDANFFNKGGCTQWNFTGQIKRLDESPIGVPITNGTVYKFEEGLILNIKNMQKNSYLFLTKGPGSLKIESNMFVIRFSGTHQKEEADIYYYCNTLNPYKYSFDALDRDGYPTKVYCRDHYTSFQVNYLEDYLSFSFPSKQYFQIYRGKDQRKSNIVNWHYNNYRYTFDINYFSITTTDAMDYYSSKLFPKALEVTSGEMISPIFNPQSNHLCLVISFYSSEESLSSYLEISALGFLSNDIHLLGNISNIETGLNVKIVNVSLENLNPIKLRIKKYGLENIRVLRISSCSPEGEEVVELPSSVTVCPSDQRIHPWGSRSSSLTLHTSAGIMDTTEIITNTTNHCWNEGVLTSGGCACTPGFRGSKCEMGCGRNRFGQDCEGLCSLFSEECRGLLLCTKFTGCRCAPGYRGQNCTQACSPGRYGNDCSQQCGHCAGNSTCDIYTGECVSCREGYLFPHCKIASVYYGSKPEVTSPSYGMIVVTFDPNNYVSEGEPPQLYQVQLREKGSKWKVYTSKSFLETSEESERSNKVIEKIEGLKAGFLYEVRVLLIDPYFLKYDGDLVQIAEVQTKCDVPPSYDYNVTAVSNTTAIAFSWKYITEDQNWCPLEKFEVSWRKGWKRQNLFTKGNFTLNGLVPGLSISFKVRAITSGGAAPYSKTVITSTQFNVLPPVQKLHVASIQSTSVKVSWEPPRGSEDRQLRYTISYKCVDRPACSPGCQNVSEEQLKQEGTSITLSPLLPFTKYLVTVSAESGVEASIYVGTTKIVPTEMPTLSAQKPVRTNTSMTVFWDQGPVCTGYLLGYNYQFTKTSDALKILASGFTKDTNASFHNLTASTEYVVRVFVTTMAGWNPQSYLAINISTSATVPEAVRNLTVYKRGRGMLGLRWAEPRATYGQLKSFTVTYSLGHGSTSETVEPSHCVVWPDLYCHTIEGLRSNKRYNISVSASNLEVAEDGEMAYVSAVTKEGPPSAPVNLKVGNSSSTSIELEWKHPEMANGTLRSFLISVEETEKYDQDSCCQIYPFVETLVKKELDTYRAEVSGLHPASTYFVSVSGKTVGLGPSQSLTAYTRPPHLPLTSLPRPQIPDFSWLPQEKLSEVNNSSVYTSLVRAHLLLAVLNETQAVQVASGSGITDPKLDSLLQQKIGKPFYFIAEYNQDDDVEFSGPLQDKDSTWGRPPLSLTPAVMYQLVATQVLEYNSVYNVDLCYSQSFTLVN